MRNAINQRKSRKYVQKIIRLIKNINIINVLNQLNFIYNNIDINIRTKNFRRSRKKSIVNNILNNFNKFKHN